MREDDPRKCTSMKLTRLHLAKPIYRPLSIPKKAVILNPETDVTFSPSDKPSLKYGLIAIDCSWKNADTVFRRRFRGINRRLPLLIAANPIHYGHVSVLSSAEALASALYISGYKAQARELMSKFKWGHTFLTLNGNVLEDYSVAKNSEEIHLMEKSYFIRTSS